MIILGIEDHHLSGVRGFHPLFFHQPTLFIFFFSFLFMAVLANALQFVCRDEPSTDVCVPRGKSTDWDDRIDMVNVNSLPFLKAKFTSVPTWLLFTFAPLFNFIPCWPPHPDLSKSSKNVGIKTPRYFFFFHIPTFLQIQSITTYMYG